jgi:uncharacterized protein (UPF0264 family)
LSQWDRSQSLGLPKGLAYAKFGLAGCRQCLDWPDRWAKAIEALPTGTRSVAVAYADWPSAGAPGPDRVLANALRLRCGAVLVDTFDKSGGGLLDRWPLAELAEFVAAVRQRRSPIALAGSLGFDTLPSVLPLQPDYIAVRGAVCRQGRHGPLDGELVTRMARAISAADSRRFCGIA